jgi:hypothetical protein
MKAKLTDMAMKPSVVSEHSWTTSAVYLQPGLRYRSHLNGTTFIDTEQAGVAVTLQIRDRKVLGSKLGRDSGYTDWSFVIVPRLLHPCIGSGKLLLAPTITIIHGSRSPGDRSLGVMQLMTLIHVSFDAICCGYWQHRIITKDKKFWEEIIAYFPFTTYWVFDTTRTALKIPRPTVVLLLCVCINCHGNVFTELLLRKGRLFWPHYFGLLDRDTQTTRRSYKP